MFTSISPLFYSLMGNITALWRSLTPVRFADGSGGAV